MMNAFSVLGATYGFVAALAHVAAKIALDRRIRRKGLTVNPTWQVGWVLDREASSDLINIFTFTIFGMSFLFVLLGEFTSFTDWLTAVASNLLFMVFLVVWVTSTKMMESRDSYGTPWTQFHIWKPWLSMGLFIVAVVSASVYFLIAKPDEWFMAGLLIPQCVLGVAIVALLDTAPRIFKNLQRAHE